MKLKYGLLASAISEVIYEKIRTYVALEALEELDIDANEVINTAAIKALSEIQSVIQNENIPDSDAIKEIVKIFKKYDISAGSRHD